MSKQSQEYSQADKLAEIGAQLKQMREVKDISLNQVTASTLIAERHLRAIEEGNMDLLPEAVYVQGFIRKYSSAVGLDGLAEEFPVPTSDAPKRWAGTPAAELRPLHLYALYVLVIAGSVSILSTFLNPSSANKLSSEQTNLSKLAKLPPTKLLITPSVKASANSSVNPAKDIVTNKPNSLGSISSKAPLTNQTSDPVSSSASPWSDLSHLINQKALPSGFTFTGNKPVNLGVVITGQSWVRVVADDETKFEGVVSEGTRQSWSAEKSIAIRAGNAAAVSVVFNGQPLKVMGEEGEVVQQLFDKTYKPNESSSTDLNKLTNITSGQETNSLNRN